MTYHNILDKLQKAPPKKLNDHVLIVDSMNLFIRNFSMINYVNVQGHHIGGLAGFLKSLGFLVRTIRPTRLVLVFDGKGSTINRKNINPDYKGTRNITKITHWEVFDTKEQEKDSMAWQIDKLIDYLHCLPTYLLSIDKVEADDVIGFLAQGFSKRKSKVTIVSSDKDFLQLVNDYTEVYSPIKKKFYGPDLVKEEFGLIPKNYLQFKALIGDQSDNLAGVKGLGSKTILKNFPYIVDEELDGLDRIFETCEENFQKAKSYLNVLANKDRVETNYKLMNIQEPVLSDSDISTILDILNQPVPSLNTGAFQMMYESDNLGAGITTNVGSWIEIFRYLESIKK
jgi:5'-3' exonuclease